MFVLGRGKFYNKSKERYLTCILSYIIFCNYFEEPFRVFISILERSVILAHTKNKLNLKKM